VQSDRLQDDHLQIDTPEQIALELPLAGIGSRFLGLAIDTLLQIVLYVIGTFVLILAGAFLASEGIGRYFRWIPVSWGPAIAILFVFCVYWGYFAFFEIIWKGQTPGKRLAKIRVIKESGRPINAYEAIARNLLRAIDALPGMYGVGIVCMMLNSQNRRIGDYVAGTVVVHETRLEHSHRAGIHESSARADRLRRTGADRNLSPPPGRDGSRAPRSGRLQNCDASDGEDRTAARSEPIAGRFSGSIGSADPRHRTLPLTRA
jgi:uncharacterized RDD family membrane protein YckC